MADEGLCAVVEGACGLVEEEVLGEAGERAGDQEPLALESDPIFYETRPTPLEEDADFLHLFRKTSFFARIHPYFKE